MTFPDRVAMGTLMMMLIMSNMYTPEPGVETLLMILLSAAVGIVWGIGGEQHL